MPDLSASPEDYDTNEAYAHAQAIMAKYDTSWAAIGGVDGPITETEWAIEPSPGDCARGHDTELAGPIEELSIYVAGARIITRQITYGPWRYVTPEEIENA
jgi:hypothetical protein